jgi:hypothetical protein
MSTARWTDAFLDSMRLRGDEAADRAVTALFTRHDPHGVQSLLDQLVRNDSVPHADLPIEIREYLDQTSDVPAPSREAVLAGQRLFAEYGPEMSMLLACYSLPVAYSARKGVQVLYRSGYLVDRAMRRVAQTAQMIIDVMTPGGLDPGGRGRRSAQKVRLMHAGIRYLILHDTRQPWPDDYGVPINQEDLAGTLMTFSAIILRGLEKLQIDLTAEQAQSYLEAWKAIGHIMGIVEDLIPATVADANVLCERIFTRQTDPCLEGRLMTTSLRDMMKTHMVPPFKGLVDAIFRHVLPAKVADGFDIPHRELEAQIVEAGIRVGHAFDRLTGSGGRRKLFRDFSIQFLQVMAFVESGGRRTRFHIPSELRDAWQLAAQ